MTGEEGEEEKKSGFKGRKEPHVNDRKWLCCRALGTLRVTVQTIHSLTHTDTHTVCEHSS